MQPSTMCIPLQGPVYMMVEQQLHTARTCFIQLCYVLCPSANLLHTAFTSVSPCLSTIKSNVEQMMHCPAANACSRLQHDMQVVVKPSPAFHLFYATGWQDAVVHMRLSLPLGEQPQVTFLSCRTLCQHKHSKSSALHYM